MKVDLCAFLETNGAVSFYEECVLQPMETNPSLDIQVKDFVPSMIALIIFLMQAFIIFRQHKNAQQQRERDRRLAFLEKNYEVGVEEPIKAAISELESVINQRGEITKKTWSSSAEMVSLFREKAVISVAKCRRMCIEADSYISNAYECFVPVLMSASKCEYVDEDDSVEDLLLICCAVAEKEESIEAANAILRCVSDELLRTRVELRKALSNSSHDFFEANGELSKSSDR